MKSGLDNLPQNVQEVLADFLETVKAESGSNLISIVLYGSAAEGRLRAASDVNLMLVFNEFNHSQIEGMREKFRIAHAAINLNIMFILETEIPTASEAFAVKFTDIIHRHIVLHGVSPFSKLNISREATLSRLNQVIINLMLRLRERFVLLSLREEQLIPVIADVTGPIRACAATILNLEGGSQVHPKEALQALTLKFQGNWEETLKNMSVAREEMDLSPGKAAATLLGQLDLLEAMQTYTKRLN